MINPEDRRNHTRIGYDMPVSFSVSILDFTNDKPVEISGNALDKSEDGLGFVTEFPLEPGQVIKIKQGDGGFIAASVKWVGKIDGKYRVGVLFYK